MNNNNIIPQLPLKPQPVIAQPFQPVLVPIQASQVLDQNQNTQQKQLILQTQLGTLLAQNNYQPGYENRSLIESLPSSAASLD